MITMIFTVLIFYNFFPSQDDYNTLNIEITELNNNNGSIVLELLDENENQILSFINIPIVDNKSTFKIDSIRSGKYALRFFNDDNENGKLDTNFFGIPKEEFGNSNNVKPKFGPPNFKDMIFRIEGDLNLKMISQKINF
tara:strand:- start:523 stop:939 length:417 start_codon:yes stop_codon:yes gene_type:complete